MLIAQVWTRLNASFVLYNRTEHDWGFLMICFMKKDNAFDCPLALTEPISNWIPFMMRENLLSFGFQVIADIQ